MSESIVDALDGAELVRAATIAGIEYIAVWHGGLGINLYQARGEFSDGWVEVDYFTIQDEEGKPRGQEEVDEAIEDHIEHMANISGEEVRR